jgi:hypothetical protein
LISGVRSVVFTMTTWLPAGEALDRLAGCCRRAVESKDEGDRMRGTVHSSSVPPVVNFDPRLCSNRHGRGINPFALLTEIELTVAANGPAAVVLSQSTDSG